MNKKYYFSYNLSPVLLLLEFLLLATIAITFDYSNYVKEFSIIENAQVGILLAACVVSIWAHFKSQIPQAARQWFLVVAILMFIFAARELSFGRAFYIDPDMPFDEELYQSFKKELPCRITRTFCNSIGVLAFVYIIWRKLLQQIPSLFRSMKIYVSEIVAIILLLPASELCEKVLESPNSEEFSELFLYLLVFNLCWRYARNVGNVWNLPDA